ncbi:MAG: hypothetical protein HYX73_06815, partial [Acidobacteria bacterium]|nr:hypothetical protein [Acidobacteriota bacterium]
IGSSRLHCSSLTSQRPGIVIVSLQIASAPPVSPYPHSSQPIFFSSSYPGTIFETSSNTNIGEVLFPNSEISVPFHSESITVVPGKTITEVRRIWVLGCISYHDAVQQIHHTKFWLRSTFPENAAWIDMTPGFRYMPIISFESWGEEAD